MKIGDKVKLKNPCDFHRYAEQTFSIVGRREDDSFGSGIGFQVSPSVWSGDHRGESVWYDSVHFTPLEE